MVLWIKAIEGLEKKLGIKKGSLKNGLSSLLLIGKVKKVFYFLIMKTIIFVAVFILEKYSRVL